MMRWLWITLVLCTVTSGAAAHPLMPVAVTLQETAPLAFELRFRRPTRLETLSLQLPQSCSAAPYAEEHEDDQTFELSRVRCTAPLAGRTVTLRGLTRELPTAIVHVQYLNGESARGLLSLDAEQLVIPARTTLGKVLLQFGGLGATHMLEGFDHLLFTGGLLLLGFGLHAVWLLSAFTLGHSVTLGLLVWRGLSLPRAPVEIGIALSLVGLASTVLARREGAPARTSLRRAAALTFAVGLLHGLGFADGLQQLSLPTDALWPALLGFNLGVELAQLGVVAALVPLLWLLAKLPVQQRLHTLAGYTIGSLAAMWCIERALELF